MKKINLIDFKTQSPIFEFKVRFFPDDYEALYVIDEYLVFFSYETTKGGLFLSDQLEIPLASLDFILTTIPRYDLPKSLGGLGGLDNSDETIVNGEKIFFDRVVHPHYGIETYSITNFNRKSHINPVLNQSKEIFKETMDGGLFDKLIEINKNYHNGVYA
ncbi:hypothetical protein [Reinekea marinisedimentorum]|uniref:Uncharacterized protein n=1 Tax=Reinekea marinisedimentorum TaxID=230495 RepID=A0A4R3I7V1_9GAMM|nr:hypothetical protein [Reinekea marinisedimentorum]TCS41901.1 hypothetical protein BCF53_1044 [Reinekea marinisedimentorum]